MSKTLRTFIATGFAAATLAVPTAAFADRGGDSNPDTWGDQVKYCNTTSPAPCLYGEGKSYKNRGQYVKANADGERGYGEEIQELDTNIGNQRN